MSSHMPAKSLFGLEICHNTHYATGQLPSSRAIAQAVGLRCYSTARGRGILPCSGPAKQPWPDAGKPCGTRVSCKSGYLAMADPPPLSGVRGLQSFPEKIRVQPCSRDYVLGLISEGGDGI